MPDRLTDERMAELDRLLVRYERIGKLLRERNPHDTQPYLTVDVYEVVCKALENSKAQVETLREALERGRKIVSSGYGHREEIAAWLADVDDALEGTYE